MATSHERAQQEAGPSGVSLVSFSVWPGADGVVIDTALHDDFVHRFQAHELDSVKVLAQFRRADELDADAAYYRHRAMQQKPGHWLLRRPAPGPGYRPGRDGAAATDRERSDVMSARDPARRHRQRVPALHAELPDRHGPGRHRGDGAADGVAVDAPASGRRQRWVPPRTEHLVPGQGNQPCAEVCRALATAGSAATVVLDGSTKSAAAASLFPVVVRAQLNRATSRTPDRKDHQHDHGRQDQDLATAARRRS
jgi:hypothetical protein